MRPRVAVQRRTSDPQWWITVFAASAGLLAILAVPVYLLGLLPGERALYDAVAAWVSPLGVSIFRKINYLGDGRVVFPATFLLFWAAPGDARRRWWLWAAVMIIAPILEGLGKQVIGRPRPMGSAFGFPSGHTTAASAYFFLAAYLVSKRIDSTGGRVVLLWVLAGVLIALVGTARVVLHAHWPGDVLAGAALGLACVSLAAWYHERSG